MSKHSSSFSPVTVSGIWKTTKSSSITWWRTCTRTITRTEWRVLKNERKRWGLFSRVAARVTDGSLSMAWTTRLRSLLRSTKGTTTTTKSERDWNNLGGEARAVAVWRVLPKTTSSQASKGLVRDGAFNSVTRRLYSQQWAGGGRMYATYYMFNKLARWVTSSGKWYLSYSTHLT